MTVHLEVPLTGSDATLAPPDAQPILPRLSGAASLRHELEALLAAAPTDTPHQTYRDLIINRNVTGKGSASARLWVWKRIKLRYVLDTVNPEFQAFRQGMAATASPDERGLLCFVMLGRTDRLFREVTLECVSPHLARPDFVIESSTIEAAIVQRATAGGLVWSASTLKRTAGHFLTALKDFGVLKGSITKRTVRLRPGDQVALFSARLARLEGLTDRQVLEARWFRLLGLSGDQVVDLLYTAAADQVLGFRRQADVVELRLPPLEGA